MIRADLEACAAPERRAHLQRGSTDEPPFPPLLLTLHRSLAEVREGVAGEDGLGDHAREREHGEAAMDDLLELHVSSFLRGRAEVERVCRCDG